MNYFKIRIHASILLTATSSSREKGEVIEYVIMQCIQQYLVICIKVQKRALLEKTKSRGLMLVTRRIEEMSTKNVLYIAF